MKELLFEPLEASTFSYLQAIPLFDFRAALIDF